MHPDGSHRTDGFPCGAFHREGEHGGGSRHCNGDTGNESGHDRGQGAGGKGGEDSGVASFRLRNGTERGGIARERAMTQPGPDGTGNLRKADGGSVGDEGTARERAMTQREDSGVVELPVIQRHYADSTYEAWVSGPLDPRLDSVRVFAATTVVTRRETGRRKRWHIGPSVGVGYTPHGFEPFIGVSVTFSILDF